MTTNDEITPELVRTMIQAMDEGDIYRQSAYRAILQAYLNKCQHFDAIVKDGRRLISEKITLTQENARLRNIVDKQREALENIRPILRQIPDLTEAMEFHKVTHYCANLLAIIEDALALTIPNKDTPS
jgi:fumarate hydratase class II